MPFERYLQPPQHHRTQRQHDNAYYTHPAEALDHFNLDPSVFSNNVQFQMPQLILGPTLAPGGGAEVLPAGIVGHPTALTSTWLTSPSIPHYGDD
ncbi:hypothetical protein PHLCEN_2v13381 [Hermanssonia centrifuga]|uniref:Uncharacterized protein n=1 Tax=Hermanssonia centrifuga TaxID=98765 RepID=A0A2R6NEJ8_9APHY|nr:hypothetical protein PHLCEN_2v13381 [Hermanssonia centrifuga]